MTGRIALLVLVLLAVWTVAKRWNRRSVSGRPPARPIEQARRCPDCGGYVVGTGPCPKCHPDG